MINRLLIILIILFSFNISSNEVEVIELHDSKSLDQIVLDKLSNDIDNVSDEISEEIIETDKEKELNVPILETNDVNEENLTENYFWTSITLNDLKTYLNNTREIKSNTLKNEFLIFLENSSIDYNSEENKNIYFNIVKYFYETGNISNSYSLVTSDKYVHSENLDFYNSVEINYLLSTFQLEAACNFKNEISTNIALKNFLLEKLDIFCLILEDNLSEADLLNSILQETEIKKDEIFQELFLIISNRSDESLNNKNFFKNIENNNLVFLYSAMARIAELSLNEDFLKIDPKNLSIPIILNQSTPINLRLKAAHYSFNNNLISVDSLAALYQSVDFDSKSLNNPTQTLNTLSANSEMAMAYYYQLINVQIFPSERLKVMIDFWDFAEKNSLKEIAYALSNKIVESIEISSESADYSLKIATSYIYNENYEKALSWIEFYENSNGPDLASSYAKILLKLYSSSDIKSILEIITSNPKEFENLDISVNKELIFIMLNLLENNESIELNNNYDSIFDQRLMPSLFILENIKTSILSNNNEKFLMYSVMSINNKQWVDLHPEHLKLILLGLLKYKDGVLIRDTIIEIFKNYNIL